MTAEVSDSTVKDSESIDARVEAVSCQGYVVLRWKDCGYGGLVFWKFPTKGLIY